MKPQVELLLSELRPLFISVGIAVDQIDALLSDNLDYRGIFDSLVVVRRQEGAALISAIALVPQSMWEHYSAHGIKYLRECKIRARAEVDLRKAFHSRVRIFLRRFNAKTGKEATGNDSQGVDLRSSNGALGCDR